MRVREEKHIDAFYYISMEDRIPVEHPIRCFKLMVNEILRDMNKDLESIYTNNGQPLIAPEYLLRASILQILYSIRSEKQLMEQIKFSILFRWFTGISLDTPVWYHSTFTKNRALLLNSDIGQLFLSKVVERARKLKFHYDEHFTVDSTLIEAWTSMKSVQAKNPVKRDMHWNKIRDE